MSRPMMTILSRARAAGLAVVAALALSACNQTDEVARKANKPLSPEMLSLMAKSDMAPSSPMLVRIFKKEAELEVWKVNGQGDYALLKTYPICRWSGELGPKVSMGDRQAPEGFYAITPGQMNPNSNYYLSFNLGFPNAFDRAYGRTGEFLMVHGDCSSAGCYAMTDEQISEIFSLARESFAGGQRSFQVQAYPFRMTPKNLARYRNNPNMAFWRNLKEGSDHFEVSRQEPKVAVCGRRYVFDATPAGGRFDANAACPPYQVPPEIAGRVAAKQQSDEAQVAALAPSSPVAPVKTGWDGGMHPVFLAKWKAQQEGRSEMAFAPQAPGTIPETTRPPRGQETDVSDSGGPAPLAAPTAPTGVAFASRAPEAPAAPEAPSPALRPDAVASAALAPQAQEPRSVPAPHVASAAGSGAAAPKPAAKPAAATAPAARAPAAKPPAAGAKAEKPKASPSATVASSGFADPPGMAGASPIVSTSGFSQ